MLAVLAIAAFLFCGFSLSRLLFTKEGTAVRLWLGVVLSLAVWMWLPALLSFALGFTALSQLLSAFIALALGGTALFLGRKRELKLWSKPGSKGKLALACVLPLLAFSIYLCFTHTLSPEDGSLHCGQSTFGDMCLHLGFITSLSEQQFFPPLYSLLPDTAVGYPFLCDSISATLYSLGLPLRLSYMLPMFFALASVFCGAFFLLRVWLKDGRKTVVGYLLFFLGGGFGFAYFLNNLRSDPGNFTRIFTAFYETPTNYVQENIRWVNPIADLLIPQRATLFGWAILFACLYLLYRMAFEGKGGKEEGKSGLIYPITLGVLGGCLPLVHTHSFLALGLVSAVLLVRAFLHGSWNGIRPFLIYGCTAVALAAPQLVLFTFRQSSGSGFLRLGWNWANDGDNYFWFYIKNIGLPYLLALPAFLHADRDSKWFFGGGLLILALCEVILFQPNPYDNNKLLYITYLLLCGLVANYLVCLWDRLRGMRGRAVLAALTLFVCLFGGVLTLGREAVSDYELFNAAEVRAAAFIQENTAPTSRFLTADNHNNTVAALTGRNILCGTSSYLYYHGLDYSGYAAAQQELFEHPTAQGLAQWGIDYVYLSGYERREYEVDEAWFSENCQEIYRDGGIVIYRRL